MILARSGCSKIQLNFNAFAILTALFCIPGSSDTVAQDDSWLCFAGVNGGVGALGDSFSVKQGEVELLFTPSDDGTLIGASIGCAVSKNWFISGEYQRMDANETELDNWLGSVNYGWAVDGNNLLYLGAVAGWSILEWQKAPVETLKQERQSEQPALGIQLGYTHQLGDRWRLNLRYMYLALDHQTNLEPVSGKARYSHDSQQNFTLGVDWHF
jgi:hypothetical protein